MKGLQQRKKANQIIKLSLECPNLWLMGNMLPGKLQVTGRLPSLEVSKLKAWCYRSLFAWCTCPWATNIREHWPDLVSWQTFKCFLVSQDKVHFLQ